MPFLPSAAELGLVPSYNWCIFPTEIKIRCVDDQKESDFYTSLLVLSAGVLCLLVNGRRCLKRPEQRTKSQSLVLACPPYPTSPWEHR